MFAQFSDPDMELPQRELNELHLAAPALTLSLRNGLLELTERGREVYSSLLHTHTTENTVGKERYFHNHDNQRKSTYTHV